MSIHTIQLAWSVSICFFDKNQASFVLASQKLHYPTDIGIQYQSPIIMEALKYLIIFVYDTVMAVKKFLGDRYGIDDLDEISKKIQCFQDFLDVMSKVDPGYSTVNVNFLLTGFSNQF